MDSQIENNKNELLENNKNLIDCCDHWLEQYHDAYRVMNRICSSHKGNRYSFQVITKVNREEDINGEEFYHITLNMFGKNDYLFFEGPSITLSANEGSALAYVLADLTNDYLKQNHIQNVKLPFTGYMKQQKSAYMERYSPASTVFDASEVNNDYLLDAMNAAATIYDSRMPSDFFISDFRSKVKEDIATDDKTSKSFIKSYKDSQKVINFGAPIQRG